MTGMSGLKHSPEAKEKMRQAKLKNPPKHWIGRKHSAESKLKQSEAKKKNPTRYWLGKKRIMPKEVMDRIHEKSRGKKRSIGQRKIMSARHVTNKEHHWWKGGRSSEEQKDRKRLPYKLWKEAVFKRDGRVCSKCGAINVTLHVHHIKPYYEYPELRLEVENGQVLCNSCHTKHHLGIRWNRKNLKKK